jgi:hypothetical protein
MSSSERDFDQVAAAWEEYPGRVKVARGIAQAITREVPLTSDRDAMGFG